MTWSIFFNRNNSSAVGGKVYKYEDEDTEKKLEIGILFEGQRCYRMDYCIRLGAHVFSRDKQSDPYNFRGIIESITIEREWSKTAPALYRIMCRRKTTDVIVCSKVQPEHIGSPYKYKKAAWEALELPIPVYKNFSSGIFDHDQAFKLKDHPLRKADKPVNLKTKSLEDTITNLENINIQLNNTIIDLLQELAIK